ncbi:sensor histidine kinase [Paenilisteria rocourtiae]|uniref:Uncharacterized protein n=2 Tax=Listeria rocourtiae TaxID=647910 RepID=A0A4R6ZJD8_9LIST|nr:hypothetical protein [Listeria rocourtiae]TDR52430.1 hypothetical protein DFP96_108104 [Listeria rocourtiae]
MYSSLFLWIAGTYQLFGIVVVTNVLAKKILSKRDVILTAVIMTIGGSLLLNTVQYYAAIYTLGVLALSLSWKGVHWGKSFVFAIVGQILFIISDYLVGVFAGKALGLHSQDYHATFLDAAYVMIIFVTPSLIVGYILALCINWIMRRDNLKSTVKYNEYALIFLLLLTIIIIYILIYLENILKLPIAVAELYIVIFSFLLLAIGIVFAIIIKVENERVDQMKQEQELAQLRDYTEKLEMLNNEMSLFKHDYINILASLRGYIDNGNQQNLEEYFQNSITPLTEKFNKEQLLK